MKTKIRFLLLPLFLSMYVFINSSAQTPYVYTVENTGTGFAAPPLPVFANCPSVPLLPDPYKWADGSGYISGISDWSHKRAEFKAQIENYEIGTKPAVDPSQITATYTSGSLKVTVTANGQSMTLTCAVSIPSGATAPYPVCIGMNSSYGSVTSGDFTSRGIVGITFSHDQVTTYNSPANTDPFFKLYPTQNIDNTGQYAAWAWGVSRIIDGLVKVKAAGSFNVDLSHICVTGCSYAGKMALFSGAFDERVALTIAQESGGGGATSWRYSATEASGTVEGLAQTDSKWFKNSMFDFGGANVSKIPTDHHMLIAMCAPRACYCTGNTDYTWLSNPSCYVATRAAAKIYSDLGIADRFGFNIDGGHTHCAFPSDQEADATYFLDKFIKGNTSLSKTIATFPSSYSSVDYAHWCSAWGSIAPASKVTGVSVSPTTLTIIAGATSQLTASILPSSASNKNVTWSSSNTAAATVSSTGLVTAVANGTATITVTTADGGFTATSAVTVSPSSNVININAGGSATGSFSADQYYSAGTAYTNTATIDMSQITSNQPPAAIFNSERYGAMSYTIPNRTAGSTQTVTLYFAETYLTASGQRIFNVSINGTSVLSNFDIYASAGGQNKAIAKTFSTIANSSGQVVIQFSTVTENPKINGISVADGNVSIVPVTGVSVSQPTVSIITGATLQLTATVAPSNATNKNVTWSSSNTAIATVSSTGLVTGVAAGNATITVTTADGAFTATSAVTVSQSNNVLNINAGGSATGSFSADQYYSAGTTYTNTATIDMSQITTNVPPVAIFNSERYGAMSYTIPNRTAGSTQTVTLYFAETYLTASGQRIFNVTINGTSVLSNFDIYASAGGQNKAIAKSFSTTANSSGQVVIQFNTVTENPKVNGISVAEGTAKSAPVGDENIGIKKAIYVYPNPVNDKLNVVLSGSGSTISLYNNAGQQLINMNTEETNIIIDMAKYSTGIYFLKITNSDRTSTEKIIKQ